jgi:hypothetical protein
MAGENAAGEPKRSRWLSHPAFLLVLTAVLTGLLVPWITSRWEERDKKVESSRVEAERVLEEQRAAAARELEVQAALVNRIGVASARFLSAMEVGKVDAAGADASAEYRALKEASLEIASQLAAYFPSSVPVRRWRDYTSNLRNAYLLLQAKPGRARNRWLDLLNRYLDAGPKQYDGLCFPETNETFPPDLRALVVALQKKEEDVVRWVTSSPTVLTGTPARRAEVSGLENYKSTERTPCNDA